MASSNTSHGLLLRLPLWDPGRILTHGKKILFACDAISISPKLCTTRTHFDIQPAGVRVFVWTLFVLRGTNAGISEAHARDSSIDTPYDTRNLSGWQWTMLVSCGRCLWGYK